MYVWGKRIWHVSDGSDPQALKTRKKTFSHIKVCKMKCGVTITVHAPSTTDVNTHKLKASICSKCAG